jgi:hypothetical protein
MHILHKLDFIKVFENRFAEISKHRKSNNSIKICDVTKKEEFSWVIEERKQLLKTLNLYLQNPINEIEFVNRIESRALGHSDYGHKLALYMTEEIEKQNG